MYHWEMYAWSPWRSRNISSTAQTAMNTKAVKRIGDA